MNPEIIVWVMLVKDDHILLLKRPADAQSLEYSLVGGHAERGESLMAAAAREVFEETGSIVEIHDLKLQHIIDRRQGTSCKLHFFFLASHWNNQPYNKEPEEHLAICWVNLKKLPPEIGPLAKRAIQALEDNNVFSSYG